MEKPHEKAHDNWRLLNTKLAIGLCIVLYVTSLFIPFFKFKSHEPVLGIMVLIFGSLGIFQGNIGWLANLAWFISIIEIIKRHRLKPAFYWSLTAVVLSFEAFVPVRWDIHGFEPPVTGLETGFYLWFGAILLLFIYNLFSALMSTSLHTRLIFKQFIKTLSTYLIPDSKVITEKKESNSEKHYEQTRPGKTALKMQVRFTIGYSVVLFIVSLFLPVFKCASHSPVIGFEVLLLGLFGLFQMNVGWFANLAWLIGIVKMVEDHQPKQALFFSLAAAVLSYEGFAVKEWWFNEGFGTAVTGMGIGFYLWFSAIHLLFFGNLFSIMLAKYSNLKNKAL